MTLPTESDDDDSKSLSISSISGWNVSSTVLIKCLPRKPENVRSAFGNRFRPVTKKKLIYFIKLKSHKIIIMYFHTWLGI